MSDHTIRSAITTGLKKLSKDLKKQEEDLDKIESLAETILEKAEPGNYDELVKQLETLKEKHREQAERINSLSDSLGLEDSYESTLSTEKKESSKKKDTKKESPKKKSTPRSTPRSSPKSSPEKEKVEKKPTRKGKKEESVKKTASKKSDSKKSDTKMTKPKKKAGDSLPPLVADKELVSNVSKGKTFRYKVNGKVRTFCRSSDDKTVATEEVPEGVSGLKLTLIPGPTKNGKPSEKTFTVKKPSSTRHKKEESSGAAVDSGTESEPDSDHESEHESVADSAAGSDIEPDADDLVEIADSDDEGSDAD